MYSINARVFLVCSYRTHFMRRWAQKAALNYFLLRFSTCSVLRCKNKHSGSFLFTPEPSKPCADLSNVGEELTGSLSKPELMKIINAFLRNPLVKVLALENGIDEKICQKGLVSFRKFCFESTTLPPDLHVTLSDIIKKAGNHLDIFPFFLRHIHEIFPHLECIDELKKIGDIREPANWYPEARKLKRKFIYHCGPTNSGKTYQAIKSLFDAESGIYCGPLKLLAVEIYQKGIQLGIPCDLITGEEVIFSHPNGASHVSCTVEMCSLERMFDVAVIDEIQMLRDPQRGWAWTKALLGLQAKEIHICGEDSGIEIVENILCTTNENVEIRKYKRLTPLIIDKPIESFNNVHPGDCVVCFNKNDIYTVAHSLEVLGNAVAVIYGNLPPLTKLSQCEKFNDPNNPCNILVATDAVGMGLNLNIRRIIFYSLMKVGINESGEMEKGLISVSQALQIAGRAGRYSSTFGEGYVTTFRKSDVKKLEFLLSQNPEPIDQAGLIPTVEQIELFSYYLPKTKLNELIDIFYNLCTVDSSLYFMCDLKVLKYLAQLIDHIALPIITKFMFCCAPVNRKQYFVSVMFIKFARMHCHNRQITADWVCKRLEWPPKKPENLRDLTKLETYHEVLELYLWLSYRFKESFPDADLIRQFQAEIEKAIQVGVVNIAKFSGAEETSFVNSNFPEESANQEGF